MDDETESSAGSELDAYEFEMLPMQEGWLLLKATFPMPRPLHVVIPWRMEIVEDETPEDRAGRLFMCYADYAWGEGTGRPALSVNAIIYGDALNPVGLFDPVAFAPRPVGWDRNYGDADWASLFPELGVGELMSAFDDSMRSVKEATSGDRRDLPLLDALAAADQRAVGRRADA